MDPRASPWHSTPQGRPPPGMVPWRGGYLHRPVPLPRQNSSIPYYQPPDPRSEYQPRPPHIWGEDARHQRQPAAPSRPESRAELYERGAYPYRPQSRQSYEEVYGAYPLPVPSEDYRAYYNTYSRAAIEEQDWRQMEVYRRQGNYWDPRYYSDNQVEQESSNFTPRDVAPYRTNHYHYEDHYLRTGHERNGTDFHGGSRDDSSLLQVERPRSVEPSLLQQYKESGLSSSSYELSQYIFDSPDPHPKETWSPVVAEQVLPSVPESVTPRKYSLPHVVVCFGARGQMVRVCPNYPADGQPAVVEIHSLEVILHDTPEQEEMRVFSGPLIREDLHKVDVMSFCQRKATQIHQRDNAKMCDASLLWQLLVLLCRQNGSMVGSDIADLLMKDCKREKYKKQEANDNLINLSVESWPAPGSGGADLLTGEVPSCTETAKQAMEKFTKLLFYGRKKEALDWAMRNQLWGHALFLSSKMDLRTYSWVMSRFTSSLAHNDPLQTLFQLMSGRIPQACTCCGDAKWGDWRPHLAVMLSNQAGDSELTHRSILTMGDTLAMKGFLDASHCCYLIANVPFGFYIMKKNPLVLLGSSHSKTFKAFATTEAIQRTEILEYCRQLRQAGTSIPSFQAYKFIYASRLADYGLTSQALHYCEGIGATLMAQTSGSVLLTELIKLAERLKFSDPCLQERPEQELEPDWLVRLRLHWRQLQAQHDPETRSLGNLDFPAEDGSIQGRVEHNEPPYNQQHLQNAVQPQENGLSQVPEYYTHHMAQATCPGMPQQQLDFQPEASTRPDGPDVAESRVPWGSQNEARPSGPSDAMTSMERLPQGNPPAVYHPPGGASGVTWQSHARLDHAANASLQQRVVNPRVRTVSECSTISVDEDAPPSMDGGVNETTEQPDKDTAGDQEQKEGKKASGSGWFSWFRSKSVKEEADPSPKAAPSSVPNLDSDTSPAAVQGDTATLPLKPKDDVSPSCLPPPPTAFMPQTGRNPFSRSAGNISKQQSARSPPISPGDRPPVPTFNPGDLPQLQSGGVSLYNPSQVPSSTSSAPPQRQKLSQRRYPLQS
ncbi:protein transport protein Sec16B [Ambystoma mexicanum]|uniref:protein transport protein Sec16B n=1 Tax=Ambystoma mexicanum TaxID=8296 RepID=UPI0037E82C4E